MQKVYCDVCKQEVKNQGRTFAGESGKIKFKLEAGIKDSEDGGDLCLFCTVKAVNTTAHNLLKRPYKRTGKKVEPQPAEAK